jgi:peptidoglycan/LPS O-acetylase OafA/YrhL
VRTRAGQNEDVFLPRAFAAPSASAAAARATAPPRGLSARPLAWIGRVSYGIYLWHVPLIVFLRAHGALPLSMPGALAVALPLTIVIAALSWHLLESPLQRRARHVTRPTDGLGRRRAVAAPARA